MKHHPNDLSDVIIHPLYKTEQFEYILKQLFIILYPSAFEYETKEFATAIDTILSGNLDTYKAYRECCFTLLLSRSLDDEPDLLFEMLDTLQRFMPQYSGSLALAEALVNIMEDESNENFNYWDAWFEDRDAVYEQRIFFMFAVMRGMND